MHVFPHHFINYLISHAASTKTNCSMIIKFKSLPILVLELHSLKNLMQNREKIFFNLYKSAPEAQRVGKHTYINSVCVA